MRPADAGDLSASLAALVRKGVIRGADEAAGEGAFRFSHLLLRDVAYEAIPMASKAELHERYGRWLAATAPEPTERDEIAGWHLEQSLEFAASSALLPTSASRTRRLNDCSPQASAPAIAGTSSLLEHCWSGLSACARTILRFTASSRSSSQTS